MAASRTSIRALRTLRASAPACQLRSLHMTGPSTYASSVLAADSEHSRRPRLDRGDEHSGHFGPDSAKFRYFNSAGALQALGDSSTIDFAYLPELDADSDAPQPHIRVPLLPSNFYPTSTKTSYTAEEEEMVMRPEISLASADSTHVLAPSAFAEVHDNSTVDFQGMTEARAQSTKPAAGNQESIIKQIWNGLVDDIIGSSNSKPAKA